MSAPFTQRANQSHYKAFVVAWDRLGRLAVVLYRFVGHCLDLSGGVGWPWFVNNSS